MSAVTIVAVAVVEHDDHYLVGTRAENQTLPGYAEFPGGKVEPNETPAAAAVRECWEESSVRVVALTETWPAHAQNNFAPSARTVAPAARRPALAEILVVRHQYDHGLLEIHFVPCVPLADSPPPRPPFRWVARAALANLQFPAANASLLAALLQPYQT